jgi:hypothetical protein
MRVYATDDNMDRQEARNQGPGSFIDVHGAQGYLTTEIGWCR